MPKANAITGANNAGKSHVLKSSYLAIVSVLLDVVVKVSIVDVVDVLMGARIAGEILQRTS